MTHPIPPERMPRIPSEKMTEAQKKAAAELAAGPRGELRGPFIALLRSPGLLNPVQKVGEYLRFNCALDRRVMELATLIAARFWTQQYEWQAHREHAMKAGLDPAIADAIAEGRRPQGMKQDEEIVYELLTETLHNKSVSDATYARAVAKFGEAGVVDLVGLAGYYLMLAMIMNMARTALPAGKSPQLAPFPY
ncbi:MAG: carboxymuconolactone decarboxylase family protein [Burkholderiales bacterium]